MSACHKRSSNDNRSVVIRPWRKQVRFERKSKRSMRRNSIFRWGNFQASEIATKNVVGEKKKQKSQEPKL